VAYVVYRREGLPAIPPGKSYIYVLAGNGVFKMAFNRHLLAIVPVAFANVAGLPPLRPMVTRLEKLPAYLLARILEDARRQAWDRPREAMYHVRQTRAGAVSVTRPGQTGTAAHLAYSGGGDEEILADVHSHCQMRAYFSATDDRDEGGFRFYAVIGRIFTRPEIALRAGVYGDYWPVPVTVLFDGSGPFRDTYHASRSTFHAQEA
jgi:PRTRC genetic system protein A